MKDYIQEYQVNREEKQINTLTGNIQIIIIDMKDQDMQTIYIFRRGINLSPDIILNWNFGLGCFGNFRNITTPIEESVN